MSVVPAEARNLRVAGAITQRMPSNGHAITHVSDTARWTALHRATESARPDALFHDPLAERLAGEHGRAIVAGVPWQDRSGWWLVARTKIIDDAIAGALANGCDRVLIGSSRRGTLHRLVKGTFQQRLESLLPKEISVEVVQPQMSS